jgi:hypothetical protein
MVDPAQGGHLFTPFSKTVPRLRNAGFAQPTLGTHRYYRMGRGGGFIENSSPTTIERFAQVFAAKTIARAFCVIIDTAKHWSHSVAYVFFVELPTKITHAPPCAQY